MATISLIRPGASHNPYFNRWFSAIMLDNAVLFGFKMSQSLF